MRRLLIALLAIPILANAGTTARYRGGNALSLSEGARGTLETGRDSAITFSTSTAKLVIPYKAIDSFQYFEPVARHLGVVPGIAVSLLRHRQHLHVFRITYHDESANWVVILEVPKESALALNEVLQNRAPRSRAFCPTRP